MLSLLISGGAPVRAWAAETPAAAPVFNTVVIDGVVDADQYARDMLERVHAEGRAVHKVRVLWVSPDGHPNPQSEAVMRVLHLGLQSDQSRPRRVLEPVHVTREEFDHALAQSVQDEKIAFQDRMLFSKLTLEDGVEPVRINHQERGRIRSLFHRAKIKTLQFLGVPNGIKTWEFYKRPPSSQKILINLVSTAIQIGLQYAIGDHFLRPVLGDDGFLASFYTSAAITLFFGVTTEASLQWRTQGVQFQGGDKSAQGGMVPSRPWMIVGSFIHSLISGQSSTAAGLAPDITFAGQLDSAVSSGNGTMTKSVWEMAIRRLQLREVEHRFRRAAEGRPMRRPEWMELGYLLNTSFGIVNSTARYLDQFHIIPGLRRTLLLLGVGGMVVEMGVKERARTKAAWHNLVRSYTSADPHGECATLLQVEYEP